MPVSGVRRILRRFRAVPLGAAAFVYLCRSLWRWRRCRRRRASVMSSSNITPDKSAQNETCSCGASVISMRGSFGSSGRDGRSCLNVCDSGSGFRSYTVVGEGCRRLLSGRNSTMAAMAAAATRMATAVKAALCSNARRRLRRRTRTMSCGVNEAGSELCGVRIMARRMVSFVFIRCRGYHCI